MADNREPIAVEPIKAGNTSGQDELNQLAQNFGDGRLVKMEKDYTKDVDEAIAKADSIASTGDIAKALESLTSLEKLSRLGNDSKSNTRIVRHMIKLCFDGQKWDMLFETILTLAKKRLIIKTSIAKMVKDACEMIEKLPTEELKRKLMIHLITVSNGKIYVEVERARLTLMVSKRFEMEGNIEEASKMLLELQVETFGSMEQQEKIEFLLEQIRLSVARSDFIRANIIAKKVSTNYLNKEDKKIQELKIKYYNLMIIIGRQDVKYLDVCRHYLAMYDTPITKADKETAKTILRSAVLYCILAKHSNEQWDLLNRIAIMRDLEQIPNYKELITLFTTQEIISWKNTIEKNYEKNLVTGTQSSPATSVFDKTKYPENHSPWKDFHMRVAEHNLRMIAKYFVQITFDRLAELLDITIPEMEEFLCDMIVSGCITDAKIDRPNRIVNLRARKVPIEELDQWANNVHRITGTLNKASHLIIKEQMVHRVLEQQ